jgi:cation transport ATPase
MFLHAKQLGKYYNLLESLGKHGPSQSIDEIKSTLALDIRSGVVKSSQYQVQGSSASYALYVPALNCAACIWLLEKILENFAALSSFHLNVEDRIIYFELNKNALASSDEVLGDLVRQLARAGYPAFPPSLDVRKSADLRQLRTQLIRIGVAAAAFANVMLFSSSVYLEELSPSLLSNGFADYFGIWSAVISGVAVFYSGAPFFRNALQSIRTLTLHVDLPIAVALMVAWGLSILHLLTEASHQVYFDSVTGLVFLLLTSRYVTDMLTIKARRYVKGGGDIDQPVSQMFAEGEHVRVESGSVIPCDGTLLASKADIVESLLSGESSIVSKASGDLLYGGSVNVGAPIEIRAANAGGAASWLGRVQSTIEATTTGLSSRESHMQKIAKWFVVMTFGLASSAAVYWWSSGLGTVFEVVCAVLIVSCPCALATAIPLVTALGIRSLRQEGILVRQRDMFDRGVGIDTVVFDKTGTLTSGHLRVLRTQLFSSNHLNVNKNDASDWGMVQAALRGVAQHPVARAMLSWSESYAFRDFEVSASQVFTGQGMCIVGRESGQPTNTSIFAGSIDWILSRAKTAEVKSNLEASIGGDLSSRYAAILLQDQHENDYRESLAVLTLSDEPRIDAADVIESLKSQRIEVYILSGDRVEPTLELGAKLNVDPSHVFGGLTPLDKLNSINQLISKRRTVMMIGDGVNDAAVVKRAHVGVSMVSGSNLAVDASDCVIIDHRLLHVATLAKYLRHHDRTIKLVVGLSFSYNAVAIVMAVQNMIHPFMAALIMPLASLTTVLVAIFRNQMFPWIREKQVSCRLSYNEKL